MKRNWMTDLVAIGRHEERHEDHLRSRTGWLGAVFFNSAFAVAMFVVGHSAITGLFGTLFSLCMAWWHGREALRAGEAYIRAWDEWKRLYGPGWPP